LQIRNQIAPEGYQQRFGNYRVGRRA
jgi:hypothetical protein